MDRELGRRACFDACNSSGLLVHIALAELKDPILLLMQSVGLRCLVFLILMLDVLTMQFVLNNHLLLLYVVHLKSSLSEVQGSVVVVVLLG